MKKLVAVLLVILACAAVAGWLYIRAREPYRGYSGAEQFVEIPPGVGTKAIGERLVAAGVLRDPMTYRIALWLSGNAKRLKAGEYRFDRPMTPAEVIVKLARGEVYVVNLTFPEGLTIAEMAKIFESPGFRPPPPFADPPTAPPPIHPPL